MRRSFSWRRVGALVFGVAVLAVVAVVPTATARKGVSNRPAFGELQRAHNATAHDQGQGDENEVLARAEQESIMRTAPGSSVSAAAYVAGAAQAAPGHQGRLVAGHHRQAVPERPGSGLPRPGLERLRIGVWPRHRPDQRPDGGRRGDLRRRRRRRRVEVNQPGRALDVLVVRPARLSIGALATDPSDGSVWVGLGEANTAFENFNGFGVYRLAAGAHTWHRVGGAGSRAATSTTSASTRPGHVYAATNAGLYRHSAAAAGPWHLVLKPDPNPANSPYRTSQITDVTFQPGTGGHVVLAALGWRGGTLPSDLAFNGFYVSQDWGKAGTFHRITPTGDIDAADIGRTSFAAGRGRIYAIVESPQKLVNPSSTDGFTNLQGVYVSKSGSPAGPWTLVADATKLANSGSAEPALGQFPGAQTWYNQYIAVDPHNPLHVYVGMEEVYESTNGGQTWTTIAPYFNSVLPCFHGGPTDCPPTAHTDQHAVLINGQHVLHRQRRRRVAAAARRPPAGGWVDLNATLHTAAVLLGRHRPDGRRRRCLGRPAGQRGHADAPGPHG